MTWLVSFFGYEHSFLTSSGISIIGGILVYSISSYFFHTRFLKNHGLSRKEYRYIKQNLKEAKRKLYRLHRAIISIRHIPSLKQRMDLLKMTRKIYSITKKEPRRFYKAERFFFTHLDSAVELTEKYVFLSSQPKRNSEIERALYDTRQTLQELTLSVEKDLYDLISNDVNQLHFELDVAKHSIKKRKDIQTHDESRRLK